MAILRPMLMPTVGVPQTLVASRRPRNMSQREFYSQSQGRQQPAQNQQLQKFSSDYDSQAQSSGGSQTFEQAPMTGDYIASQLERIRGREAPPQLDPGARVKSPEAELVQPSNFQMYYQQLQTIRDASQQMTGAAAARNAFQGLNDSVGTMSGMPYQNFRTTGGSQYVPRGNGKSLTKGGKALGAVPSNPAANFKYAQNIASQFGWGADELGAWYTLGMKESGWRNTAQNPTSTAYGIGQFLNSTWAGTGIAKTSDPQQQVLAMAKYIKNRYGSPSRALSFHLGHNWY